MQIITRFAPSPTGYLHIGSARTALFNWLFTRHHGGKFLLRIEDTDRQRSTEEAIQAIFDGLTWLELFWDGDVIMQFSRADRHRQVAYALLETGKAYYCYCTPEELETLKEQARKEGKPPRYNGYWRDRSPTEAPAGVAPVIRLKMPQEGETVIEDQVQGVVRLQNQQLDDMILLRADGTPTYMLSVVVDDYDAGITHIIRGDDHLTNAFRQFQLYKSMDWKCPVFAHIPLIHGEDGAKLSKRHGALGVNAYQEMGILPEAMRNYLLRLGWSHGNEEIIPTQKAIEWFNLENIGRSASRFSMDKLLNLNGHYLREKCDEELIQALFPYIETLRKPDVQYVIPALFEERLRKGLKGLKIRAKTLVELAESALFYGCTVPLPLDQKAQEIIEKVDKSLLLSLQEALSILPFSEGEKALEATFKAWVSDRNIALGALAHPLRIILCGKTVSPSIFEMMEVLGKEETLSRLNYFLGKN